MISIWFLLFTRLCSPASQQSQHEWFSERARSDWKAGTSCLQTWKSCLEADRAISISPCQPPIRTLTSCFPAWSFKEEVGECHVQSTGTPCSIIVTVWQHCYRPSHCWLWTWDIVILTALKLALIVIAMLTECDSRLMCLCKLHSDVVLFDWWLIWFSDLGSCSWFCLGPSVRLKDFLIMIRYHYLVRSVR